MQIWADKPKTLLGQAFAWVVLFAIVGAITYGLFSDYRQSHLSRAEAAKVDAWASSLEHAVETIPLHAVEKVGSDGYIAANNDGERYRLRLDKPDDCGIIAPGELSESLRSSGDQGVTPQEVTTMRQREAQPILLKRYKPTDGDAFWTIAQGTEECAVEVKH